MSPFPVRACVRTCAGYAWLMSGQVLCAMGQPFFTNAPAKIAAEWFLVDQRTVATTIGAMFNPVGIAIGQVLPGILVVPHGRGKGIPLLLLVEAALASAGTLACLLFFHERPPTPPSR